MKTHWLKDHISAALDFVYPPLHNCPGCGAEDIPLRTTATGLCSPCHATFPWVEPQELPRDVSVVAHYEGAARALVSTLKSREGQYLAPLMAHLMAEALVEKGLLTRHTNWVVIPVPLHPSREKQRGYNQSQLLASCLAGILQATHHPRILVRQKKTAPLHRLSRQQRAEVLLDSITLKEIDRHLVCGQPILLVDDIYTTGATANACRDILQQSDPDCIELVTFAMADVMTSR